jgi:REP-associated tyrosine transposase
MARPLRLEFPGALFHVTSRGNEQRDIFRDDDDRLRFLESLQDAVDSFRWILTAYVLMSNHVHLLLQLTEDATLSAGMQWLNGTYALAFNRRHRRVGHLFQGRFHAPIIEKETYFLNVARYVVLNPVRAGIVANAGDYVWSSHRAMIGATPVPTWLAAEDLLANFGPARSNARHRYCRFVNDPLAPMQNPWTDLVGEMYLGSETWVDRMREKVELRPRCDAHPRDQRILKRPSMTEVVTAVADVIGIDEDRVRRGHGGIPRMLAAWLGSHEGFLTNSEIAAGLRLRSASRVTALVRSCDRQLDDNDEIREAIDRCVATLGRKNSQVKL